MHEGLPRSTHRASEVSEQNWLDARFVLAMHKELIATFGGRTGVLSSVALEATINKPKQVAHYEPERTVYYLAAAYAYGFIKNHGFVDGNKRVALVAACVFLAEFDIKIDRSLNKNAEVAALFLDVAARTDETQDEAIARLERWFVESTIVPSD